MYQRSFQKYQFKKISKYVHLFLTNQSQLRTSSNIFNVLFSQNLRGWLGCHLHSSLTECCRYSPSCIPDDLPGCSHSIWFPFYRQSFSKLTQGHRKHPNCHDQSQSMKVKIRLTLSPLSGRKEKRGKTVSFASWLPNILVYMIMI